VRAGAPCLFRCSSMLKQRTLNPRTLPLRPIPGRGTLAPVAPPVASWDPRKIWPAAPEILTRRVSDVRTSSRETVDGRVPFPCQKGRREEIPRWLAAPLPVLPVLPVLQMSPLLAGAALCPLPRQSPVDDGRYTGRVSQRAPSS
jgi:hypothetical protein